MAPKKSVKTNKRGRKLPTTSQLSRDYSRSFTRNVRKKDGSKHQQGVMHGTKYGYRAGVAEIGGKRVAYSSRRRSS